MFREGRGNLLRGGSGLDSRPVIIVGAGMAGLACAVSLVAAGSRVLLLEASDGVGGRIRTDRHPDGYLLDRGFQILLSAYPAAQRVLDLDRLQPGAFDAGAWVWTGQRRVPLADPFRHPSALARDLSSSLFSLTDKLFLARYGVRARTAGWSSAAEAAGDDDLSAADELWAQGFSRRFVDRFARPFWGGILLDPTLASSAGPLRFTLKMMLQGNAVLPKAGIGAMPAQLSARLPEGTVRLNAPVDEVIVEAGRATGVRLGDERIAGSAVVVATDPPAARRLTDVDALPDTADGVGSTTVYLASDRDPGLGPRLVLDGTGKLIVNHLAPLSSVQPSYAPAGRHLLAAVVIGDRQALPDDELAGRARNDAARMIGHGSAAWAVVSVCRVPFSQFAQPPGIYRRLPATTTPTAGLFLAGEATVDSSYNGAILSGERAAAAVLTRR